MQTKYLRILGLIGVVLALVLALGMVVAQDDLKILRVEAGESDIPTLDPALATDSSSIQVLNETYVGLTHLDEVTQELQPGLATSWDVVANDDGTTTYTFHLRDDVSWVRYNAESGQVEQVLDENGAVRMVTAFDIAYGWTRTLDPRTASDYAYVLAPQIVGGNEFNTQELEGADAEGVDLSTLELEIGPETLGFEAVDATTFVVTSPYNFAFTPAIYGLWMARPQPQWAIEEFGDFWIEAENFVAYGPFAVKEWLHDESLTMIKNPFWPGNDVAPVSQIDEVVFVFIDQSTAMAEYEAGNLDYIDDVSTSDIPRIKADPELSQQYVEGTQACTYYYGFSVGVAPMDNVHLRRALSYAIDRQDIVDNITRSGQQPAPFFSNPSVAASPLVADFPDLGISYDPDMAQEELALALEEMGLADVSELPAITLLFNTSEAHQLIAEAIQQMWLDELGIEVQLTNQEFGVYLQQRPTFPVWRAGWCSDYPDNHNFLYDVFHSSSNNNDTGWSNPEFDALVEEAAGLTDYDARIDLYAQAEEILIVEEAAILPIYFYSDVELTQPYVERTYSTGGDQRFEKWDINQ
jgi:oligopeptide transport system substrate-binding protein